MLDVEGGLIKVHFSVVIVLKQPVSLHVADFSHDLLPPAVGSVLMEAAAPDAVGRKFAGLLFSQFNAPSNLAPFK